MRASLLFSFSSFSLLLSPLLSIVCHSARTIPGRILRFIVPDIIRRQKQRNEKGKTFVFVNFRRPFHPARSPPPVFSPTSLLHFLFPCTTFAVIKPREDGSYRPTSAADLPRTATRIIIFAYRLLSLYRLAGFTMLTYDRTRGVRYTASNSYGLPLLAIKKTRRSYGAFLLKGVPYFCVPLSRVSIRAMLTYISDRARHARIINYRDM